MGTYKFRQAYLYGDDWDGELINIPESAVFYKIDELTENQQEWYIMISKNEFNLTNEENIEDVLFGDGCAQVRVYSLFEYYIINLHNIKPYDGWHDIGEIKFYEQFFPFFESCYVYEYIPAKYESSDEYASNFNFKKVSDEKLVSAHRLKGLASDGSYIATRVIVYDPLKKKKEYCIDESNINMYLLEDGSYDPFHLKTHITQDSGIYKHSFELVTNSLF